MIPNRELKERVLAVTEAIRKVFTVDGELDEADVGEIHEEFLACLDAVNARLKKCDELLRKGLRNEAIQECEVEPNVLDMVIEMDLPEWDSWKEYVTRHGFPPQNDLLLEVYSELNEAYTAVQPLEKLLRLHRLHALNRSPLPIRLDVLRALRATDPDNAAWETDLNQYERPRLREIDVRVKELARTPDLEELSHLHKELLRSDWQTAPPEGLKKNVAVALKQEKIRSARRRLEVIEKELNDAFSDFDFDKAMQLREDWFEHAEPAQLSDDDPLARKVAPAFDWLENEEAERIRQQDFERAVQELELGLDQDSTTRSELERLFSAAERFEEEVPSRLIRRYSEKLKSLDTLDRRRMLVRVVFSVVAVVAIGVGVAAIAFMQYRASQMTTAITRMTALVDNNELGVAADFAQTVKTSQAFIYSTPEFSSLVSKLQEKQAAEQQQQQQFERLVQDVEAVLDKPDLEIKDFAAIQPLMDQIKNQAEKDPRKQEISVPLEGRIATQRNEIIQAIEAQFDQDAESLINRASDQTLSRNEISLLLQEAELLVTRAHVSDDRKTAIKLLISKLQDRIKSYDVSRMREAARQKILNAAGQPAAFRSSLESYIEKNPRDPQSADYQKVIDDHLPVIEELKDWNELAAEWNAVEPFQGNRAVNAQRALSVIKKLAAKKPLLADIDEVTALKSRLEQELLQESSLNNLVSMLESPLYSMKVVYLKDRSQKPDRYYLKNAPPATDVRENRSFLIQPLVSPTREGEEIKVLVKDLRPINDPAHQSTDFITDAPHALFARKALTILKDSEDPFELKIARLLYELLNDQLDMEPQLRLSILKEVLKEGRKASSLIAKAYDAFDQPWKNYFSPNWIPTAKNWSDRVNALDYLQKTTGKPDELYKQQVAPELKRLAGSLPRLPTFDWVGILAKNGDRLKLITASDNPRADMGERGVFEPTPGGYRFKGLLETADGPLAKLSDTPEGMPLFRRNLTE